MRAAWGVVTGPSRALKPRKVHEASGRLPGATETAGTLGWDGCPLGATGAIGSSTHGYSRLEVTVALRLPKTAWNPAWYWDGPRSDLEFKVKWSAHHREGVSMLGCLAVSEQKMGILWIYLLPRCVLCCASSTCCQLSPGIVGFCEGFFMHRDFFKLMFWGQGVSASNSYFGDHPKCLAAVPGSRPSGSGVIRMWGWSRCP